MEMKDMPKFVLALSLTTVVLALAPAQAQESWSCSEAEIVKMELQARKLADEGKRQAAMKEMSMARDMKARDDIGECNTRMGYAKDLMQVGR
jgi:hypothetical protein